MLQANKLKPCEIKLLLINALFKMPVVKLKVSNFFSYSTHLSTIFVNTERVTV